MRVKNIRGFFAIMSAIEGNRIRVVRDASLPPLRISRFEMLSWEERERREREQTNSETYRERGMHKSKTKRYGKDTKTARETYRQ